MTRSKLLGRPLLALGALCVVSALAAALLLLPPPGPAVEAASQGPKTEMHIAIVGVGVFGEPVTCDSRTGATCKLATDSAFAVQIVPSTIPDGVAEQLPAGYAGWQTQLDYGALLYKPASNGGDEVSWDRSFFPVRAPLSPTGKEGQIGHGDVSAFFPDITGLFPVSTQKSAFLILNFNCSQNAGGDFGQLLSLPTFEANNTSGTTFVQPNGATLSVPNVSALTVQCNQAIITPTPVPSKTRMSLQVAGVLSGNPVACDSLVQTTCTLELGSTFTLSIVPDDPPLEGYAGWQTLVDYGDLLYLPQSIAAENKWDLAGASVRGPSAPTGKEGQVGHGDASVLQPPAPVSTQSAAFVSLRMSCLANGQETEPLTQFVELIGFDESLGGAVYLGSDLLTRTIPNLRNLEISCVKVPPSVGGIALDPDTSALALQTSASSGSGVAAAIAAGATAAVALAGAAWVASRRRAR